MLLSAIAGATAVVTLENTKILEEYSHNDDDYFNTDDKEYQIEVLVAPKKNENIRYTKAVRLLFYMLLKVRFVPLSRNNSFFFFEETLAVRCRAPNAFAINSLVSDQRNWAF